MLGKKAQLPPASQAILAFMFIIIVGIILYAFDPVLKGLIAVTLGLEGLGILDRLLLFSFRLIIWLFYLLGAYLLLKRGIRGELDFE